MPLPAARRLMHPLYLLTDVPLVILFVIAAVLLGAGIFREGLIVGGAAVVYLLLTLSRGIPATIAPGTPPPGQVRRVRLLRDGQTVGLRAGELTDLSLEQDRIRLSAGYRVPFACRVVESLGLVVAPPGAPPGSPGTKVRDGESLAPGRMVLAGRAIAEIEPATGRPPRLPRPPRPESADGIEPMAPLLAIARRNLGLLALGAGTLAALIGALLAGRGALPGREALLLAAGLIALAVPPGLPVHIAASLRRTLARTRRAGLALINGGSLEQLARTSFFCLDRQAVLTAQAAEIADVAPIEDADGDERQTELALLRTARAAAAATDGLRAERLTAALDLALSQADEAPSQTLAQPAEHNLPGFYAGILPDAATGDRIAILGPAETMLSQWLTEGAADAPALPAGAEGVELLAVADAPLGAEPVRLSPGRPPAGLRLLGLIAIDDPLPEGSGRLLRYARAAGTRSALIAEEDVNRVRALGQSLGLVQMHERVPRGIELRHDPVLGFGSIDNIVRPSRIFAETGPAQPLMIAGSYDRDNHRVLLTELAGSPAEGDSNREDSRVLRIAVAGRSDDQTIETAHGILLNPDPASLFGALAAARYGYREIRAMVQSSIGFGIGLLLLAAVLTLGGWSGLPSGTALLALALILALLLGPTGPVRISSDAGLPRGEKRGAQRLWRPGGVLSACLTGMVLVLGGVMLAKIGPGLGSGADAVEGAMLLYLAVVATGRALVLGRIDAAEAGIGIAALIRGGAVLALILAALLWPPAAAALGLGTASPLALAAGAVFALLPVGVEEWLRHRALSDRT